MNQRTYGTNYQEGRDVKDDAALIRSQIKGWVKDGTLPDWSYRVRISRYSMGQSIDVTATSPRATLLMEPGFVRAPKDRDWLVRVPVPRSHSTGERQLDSVWMSLRLAPGDMHEVRWVDAQTDEAKAVYDRLDGLVQSFNHDGSDIMTDYFDVKFYGHVTLDVVRGLDRWQEPLPRVGVPGPPIATKHTDLAADIEAGMGRR